MPRAGPARAGRCVSDGVARRSSAAKPLRARARGVSRRGQQGLCQAQLPARERAAVHHAGAGCLPVEALAGRGLLCAHPARGQRGRRLPDVRHRLLRHSLRLRRLSDPRPARARGAARPARQGGREDRHPLHGRDEAAAGRRRPHRAAQDNGAHRAVLGAERDLQQIRRKDHRQAARRRLPCHHSPAPPVVQVGKGHDRQAHGRLPGLGGSGVEPRQR